MTKQLSESKIMKIAELRLNNHTNRQIAKQLHTKPRTISYWIAKFIAKGYIFPKNKGGRPEIIKIKPEIKTDIVITQ